MRATTMAPQRDDTFTTPPEDDHAQAHSALPRERTMLTPPALLIVGACFLTYAASLFQEYAFTDDYAFLLGESHDGPFAPWMMIAGRPLLALVETAAFSVVQTVSGLAWLRAVSVLGLSAFAVLLHRHLVRHGWTQGQSVAAALAAVSVPAPMLFASWSVCFPFPWAMAAAGLAFVVMERASGRSMRTQAKWLALSTTLLTASVLTYQPAAPAFWTFLAAAFFSAPGSSRVALAVRGMVVFAVSGSVGIVAAAIGKALHPGISATRTALTSDILGKGYWFVREPLVEALNLVSIRGSLSLAILVGVVIAVGLWNASRQAAASPWVGLIAAPALLAIAYSPNLLVAENFASYRSEASLSIMAVMLAAIAARALLASRTATYRATTATLSITAAVFLLAAAHTSQSYIVRPQATELSWVRAVLSSPTARVLVIPRWGASVAPDTIHDELGFPTITTSWSAKAQIRVVVREHGYPAPQISFPESLSPDEFRVTSDTTVVDTQWLVAMNAGRRP